MIGRLLRQLMVLVALVCLAPRVHAQASVQVRTQASSRSVEVGEPFTITFTAVVEDPNPLPHSPLLRPPPGVTSSGPSIASQQQISLSGGTFVRRSGIAATWTLEAQKPGHYRIGPPSVEVKGQRVSGDVVDVDVVPAGQGKKKGFDPFDPFGMGFPPFPKLPSFGDEPGDEPQLPPFPEELRVSRPDDPIAFLRVVASPSKVVVGEQVTLRIYAYGARGPFREANTSEPSREAFLAHALLENSYSETMYRVPIAGEIWHAKKVRELALFPIRAGQLSIGSMRMGFEGRGYPSTSPSRGLARTSSPVTISVSEPPLAGRPPGYKLGDVGRFTLSANVEPREIAAGESVSVVAKLEGTGNLPFELRVPRRTGVQWLEPSTVEEIEPRGSTIGGWRKFTYVVRIDTPGDVDLGELRLPYWDPERDRYDTAVAKLGVVKVSSTGKPLFSADPDDPLQGVLAPRKTLGADAPARSRFSDRGWFWLAIVLCPLSVVLTSAGVKLGRRWRQQAVERKHSHSKLAARAIAAARDAAKAGDVAAAAAAAERAVIIAIEGALGLKARGVLRDELGAELTSRGVDQELAQKIVDHLRACEAARFEGLADVSASEWAERAHQLTRRLGV
jgi:hypothetical protein